MNDSDDYSASKGSQQLDPAAIQINVGKLDDCSSEITSQKGAGILMPNEDLIKSSESGQQQKTDRELNNIAINLLPVTPKRASMKENLAKEVLTTNAKKGVTFFKDEIEQLDRPLLQAEQRDRIQHILDFCDSNKKLLEQKFGD